MSGQADLNIRTFIPTDLAQVRELFVSGLMEFAGDVEREVRRYVDQSLNDDLADIPGHYLSHPRSNFWVVESGGPAVGIVGIVGIQPREREEEAELRRMSVSSPARRQGIGRPDVIGVGDRRRFLPDKWLPADLPVFSRYPAACPGDVPKIRLQDGERGVLRRPALPADNRPSPG